MDACRYGSGCWRPLCPYGRSVCRASGWAAIWSLLAEQEENLEVIKVIPEERIPEHIEEQTVDFALSSGEAGSCWFGTNDTTSTASAAHAESVCEAQPPGIAKHSASTEPNLAVSLGEFWPEKSVGEVSAY